MKGVSGERIWSEFKRIVVGRYASEVINVMLAQCQLGPFLGLKEGVDLNGFTKIYNRSVEKTAEGFDLIAPCTVLTALFNTERDVMDFHKKCKISNNEKQLCMFLIRNRLEAELNRENMMYFKMLIMDEYYLNSREFQLYLTSVYSLVF